MTSLYNSLTETLARVGYEEVGGGRNFSSYEKPGRSAFSGKGRTFYVFGTVPGSGPDDSHWVEVNGVEEIVAGGFSAESLEKRLSL